MSSEKSTNLQHPTDGALESAVLARMLWGTDDAASLSDQLVPSDFVTQIAREMFVLLAGLAATGKAADPVSVGVRLKTDGSPELVALYESLLAHSVLSVEFEIGAEELAEAFKAWSYAERFKQIIEGASLALTMGKPTAKIEKRVEERMVALQASVKSDRTFDDRKKQLVEVVDYYSDTDAAKSGLTWGIQKLDREILPTRPGNLFIIGGRQKAGKSTAARNIYDHWATLEPGVLFSLEMSSLEQWVNLASMHTGIPVTSYYRRILTSEQQRAWGESLGRLQNGNLTINDRAALTPEMCLRAMARYVAAGARWFVLDHLHRFDYGEVRSEELRVPIGNFARNLKSFAMIHKVKVMALSQLKMGSPHDEPDESSFRETSKIGEECDGSFFVYRPYIACEAQPDGTLRPMIAPGGGRYFEHDKPRGSVLGVDEENCYIKPSNFRIAPPTSLYRIPFDKTTGKFVSREPYAHLGN